MAKSSRYSGGYYRNAVHPACESEGSVGSGRVDAEITASEDSSRPPIRKCAKINTKNHNTYVVPIQLLPLSNISPFERKDLIHRLRIELEKIRGLQKKVESQISNAHTLSSSTSILCCSSGQKSLKANSLKKSSTLKSEPEKNLNVPGQKGQHKGSAVKFEPAPIASLIQASTSSTANSILMKKCEALLKQLMTHQYAWVFNAPVDVVKLNIPDYLTIIKQPMDLGTVKNKIVSAAYSNPLEFVADVRLTFRNAMTYNPPGNDVHIMADTLHKYFEVRWKSIEKKLPKADDMSLPAKPDVCADAEIVGIRPAKKRKIMAVAPVPELKVESTKNMMTIEEKHRLGRELESLIGEVPMHIIDVLREHISNGQECGEDEIEIDIDDLSDDTLFILRKLLDDYLKENQRSHEKAEPCEIELINESGPSNSSVQPCKDNDIADEEVDVGGNDHPVSSCPVELENDVFQRSNQNLRPGNTGDSDSSSLSENESDNYRRSPENMPMVLENLSSLAEDEKTRTVDHKERTEASGLDQLEQAALQKPYAMVSDCHQNGESARTQKNLRAAQLKKRFADTILKAREKTFPQGDKRDPEKLRREREKLKIEQQKEKARLQAEAKAAEEAQKRAEEEDAAEARRKRELEREAARQALLLMEKTVEINENSRFLEVLEMLRAAPADTLPSSADETSTDRSPDGLGSFKFVGDNPLVQLGLYMKEEEEEEEEEEGEVPCLRNSENVEGEIDFVG